jgi:SAM-dependent methyltransferase
VSQYVDYAEYYDVDHDTTIDIDFYLDYARQCGSPILELACGTGRVLIPVAEAGHEIYGLDLNENMLERCRKKVAQRGLGERVRLFLADMAAFELPRADFGLAYIPVRSFMHLNTQAEQIACMECVFACLRPGGLFVIDVYAPSYRHMAQEPDRPFSLRRESRLPNGHTLKRWDRFVRNDPLLQIQHSELRFEEYDAEGALVRERALPLTTRYTFRWEMQLLFERAGFEVVDVFRDYDRNPYDGTGEIITVARKPGERPLHREPQRGRRGS